MRGQLMSNTSHPLTDNIRHFWSKRGYDCKQEYDLKELVSLPIRVDLLCRKKEEIVIVEAKTGEIKSADITQIANLRRFSELSNAKLFLAVPKTAHFSLASQRNACKYLLIRSFPLSPETIGFIISNNLLTCSSRFLSPKSKRH